MIAIYKKELRSYFQTPIGYAFAGFFLLMAGVYFYVNNMRTLSGDFTATLGSLSFVFMIVVPVLTMRLLAEERRAKTDQMLLTAPVSVTAIVIGKYLAAVTLFFATLLLTLIYPAILARYGDLPLAQILGGYLGFFLLGSALIAVGLCMSALSENQVTAAGSAFAVLLAIYMMDKVAPSVSVGWVAGVLSWLSAFKRFEGFATGMLQLTAIIYYVSFSGLFVFLCVRAIEKRRWSGS